MGVVARGNFIYVQPGELAYKVASNFTNYLELGLAGLSPYYLEAKIESGAFLINGVLLGSDGNLACRIRDNFPEASNCRKERTFGGYRIVAPSGDLLLGIEVQKNICLLKGKIYDSDGSVVAEDSGDDFLIYRGPAVLGRSNGSRGIVIR